MSLHLRVQLTDGCLDTPGNTAVTTHSPRPHRLTEDGSLRDGSAGQGIATKSGDLNSIPRAHVLEGEPAPASCPLASPRRGSVCGAHTPTAPHTHTQKQVVF